ncbi:MAG: transposase [Christensenellaceae bacterium]|jgi:transposase|nr:transposase [Christensenellaceae bacterium]
MEKYVDLYKLVTDFKFDLNELVFSLIFAKSVCSSEKTQTFHDLLPCLYKEYNYSRDQMLDGLTYIGKSYERFIEMFLVRVKRVYGIDTDKTYFYSSNFYFEIDKATDFSCKVPSPNSRKDIFVGMSILFDESQIPIAMKLYPKNESEKPVLKEVMDQMKKYSRTTKRTIHVACKGLNYAKSITYAMENGNGYIFSRTLEGLPDKEEAWVLSDSGFKSVKDNNDNILYLYKSCIDELSYTTEYDNRSIKVHITEKRLLTFNPALAKKKREEIKIMVDRIKFLTLSKAKWEEYGDVAKYVSYRDRTGNQTILSLNQEAIDRDLRFAGYNLLVTSETQMNDHDIYDTYHNLSSIEESFKIMKFDLDKSPIFLQNENSINGHFLICFFAVMLERIFQAKILENKFIQAEIIDFSKSVKVLKTGNQYINISTKSKIIDELSLMFSLPLNSYYLSEAQVSQIFAKKK